MDLLDLDLIRQYREVLGSETYLQTIALYEEQSWLYIEKLTKAIASESYQDWQDSCHILKSASGNTGLKLVYGKASELEYSKQQFSILANEIPELTLLNQQSISAIKKWLTGS